uniref:Coiled-coil domain-containing protein 102A n=1 Tax=Parastrongyloides trichosuri TaxID=131310 RepID=A0A0N4ZUF1_PARTI
MEHQKPNVHNRYENFEMNERSNIDDETFFSRTIERCQHTNWDACENIRLQEINEIRERSAQMEKTMRWWSDCTASWREKWKTVKKERNDAREEIDKLKHQYETLMNDYEEEKEKNKILEQKIIELEKMSYKNNE